MEEIIQINVSKAELKKRLAKKFSKDTPHAMMIASCIIDNLCHTEAGLSNLMNAFDGVEMNIEDLGYNINEQVRVHQRSLSSYSWDKDAMKKARILVNDTVEAQILEYDRTKRECVKVKYNYISESNSSEIRTNTDWISLDPKYVSKINLDADFI